MSTNDRLRLRFWGVRGSVPTPQMENLGYGGNTACLEVRYGDDPPLILDAGSGIRPLALALARESGGRGSDIGVLLTHFHWDHIQGIPFFSPIYDPASTVTFYSARSPASLQEMFEGQMGQPFFAARSAVQADLRYSQVEAGGIQVRGLSVRTAPVRHPGGSVACRIDTAHSSVVYATDHEHGDEDVDTQLCGFARGADVLIYDAQYTPEEYAGKRGWGHSTWAEATRIAREAQVSRLVLFHHDPQHDDRTITAIEAEASREFSNTIAAREDLCITL